MYQIRVASSVVSPGRRAAVMAALVLGLALTGGPAVAGQTVRLGQIEVVDQGLVGVARLPASIRDEFGETFGSASGLAFDDASWSRTADGYQGTLYMQPDRGYNLLGTTDYQPRINRLSVTLKPADPSSSGAPRYAVEVRLVDTVLLTDPAGQPLTSLDPVGIRPAIEGFPPLPQAVNGKVSLDAEGIVRLSDGSFFVSDEYGPYVYRFSAQGRMLAAIRPPEALIPRRNGRDHFSSDTPAAGAPRPEPRSPDSGRQNNQGFEGLSLAPGGRFLLAALQSATRQDTGGTPDSRGNTRVLIYDLADLDHPRLVREHVFALPAYDDARGRRRIAAQSELLAIDEHRFLLLCRDSGAGYGAKDATSRYRRIVLVDVSGASNIAGTRYDGPVPVAPQGVLAPEIVPASVVSFIDINDNAQLLRAGLRNGPPNDADNLPEKWESLAAVPVLDPVHPRDVFLFVGNDNDFATQNGFQAGIRYADSSGVEIDTMFLVYRVTLPHVP